MGLVKVRAQYSIYQCGAVGGFTNGQEAQL